MIRLAEGLLQPLNMLTLNYKPSVVNTDERSGKA